MKNISFAEAVARITEEDSRYSREAYQFVREALDFAVAMHAGKSKGVERHVSGQELLEGIRKYAVREYGPMALTLLNTWGIRKCEDFGEIVFNLVKNGILRKTDEDSIHDFEGGYDFDAAFRAPFQPEPREAGIS